MGSYATTDDPEEILEQLTLEEKVSLLAGLNFWQTTPVKRLRIPSVKVTDGPNGARGSQFFDGVKAACFPASVSLAATWDCDLARQVGNALAEETISKNASCLLGPTVCPHRSPLGGRNFESFSEDPLLAGEMAAQYVIGLQENGVGATLKHYACNEQETQRYKMNVNVSQRALREIYLKPFEIAIRRGKPWALMTSYNLVNGTHADSNIHLLQTILRDQWRFDGLVMSDWGGTNSVAESIAAGVDLEMPGPANHRRFEKVKKALDSGSLDITSVDKSALSVLKFKRRARKFDNLDGAGEQAVNNPAHQKLIREAGADGMVLLKNDESILPLKKGQLKSVAILGLGKKCLAHGGGSAVVNAHYHVTPFDGLKEFLGEEVKIVYSQGAHIFRKLPSWTSDVAWADGQPGFSLSIYQSRDLRSEPESVINCPGSKYLAVENRSEAVTLEGTYEPSIGGLHYFSFSGIGESRFIINDQVIAEVGSTDDVMGSLMGGLTEVRKQFPFVKGQDYRIRVESFAPNPDSIKNQPLLAGMVGFNLGFMSQQDYEADLVSAAVEAAISTDVALVFVGHTPEWESEGHDRDSVDLPAFGSQDRLIQAVSNANPKTIVINFTGTAISMPWLASVSAVIQAWFPGQEAGNSIVDILFGNINPSGKLPISIPYSLEATPTYQNFPGDVKALQVRYEEGVEIGYRYYDKHLEKVLFPFGFGLSYTNFVISDVVIDHTELVYGSNIRVQADVKNCGSVAGKETLQVYVAPVVGTDDRPLKVLAGFTKVELAFGERRTITVDITYEAAAFWDESNDMWRVEKGEYDILVGNSSRDISGRGRVAVKETFTYKA